MNTRVMVVDDEPEILELVTEHLQGLGFKDISSARDGREAFNICLEAANAGRPIELAVVDWRMPKMTGIEFLKKIRENTRMKSMNVIFLTAVADPLQIKEALMFGVVDYILKPFENKDFDERVMKIQRKIESASTKKIND